MNQDVTQLMAGYEPILRRFIQEEISGQQFETEFLDTWRRHRHQASSPQLDIINEVFYDVDEYVDDPDLRERAGGQDAASLRVKVLAAYRSLYGREPGAGN